MSNLTNDNGKVLTIKEASKYAGLSVSSLRRMINNGRLPAASKVITKKGMTWVIPEVECVRLKVKSNQDEHCSDDVTQKVTQECSIPLTYFEERRREWESERSRLLVDISQLTGKVGQLEIGLEVYRYKFEEADRQVKLLTAPQQVKPWWKRLWRK